MSLKTIIKNIISIILVSSLMIGSLFTYVEARDIKLSIICLLDAIEDMEYKERESAYREEHLSFLELDESDPVGASDSVEADDSVGASTASPSEVDSVGGAPERSDKVPLGCYASPSEVDVIEEIDYETEPEDDTGTGDLREPPEATVSEVEEETDEPKEATVSEVKNEIRKGELREPLFGATPAVEVFDLPISSSTFSLKAITKKSSRGGKTFAGIAICGLMQAGSKSTDTYSYVECNNPDRHSVSFKVYKEDATTGDVLLHTEEAIPGGSFSYPDYGTYGSFGEDKTYNVQSSIIPYNGNFTTDTIYHVTEQASGCENTYNVEPVDPLSTITPMPMKNKHTGAKVYDMPMENTIADSLFLLYKVKFGDSLSKIAKHYGTTVDDIKRDNHFEKSFCYEGDILFIRDPDTVEPFENELTASELNELKNLINERGYDAAICAFGLEPVNMSTGDFYLEHTDAEIKELGEEDFKLNRSYNSTGRKVKSDFGYGFSSIVSDRLMVGSGGTVIHFAPDGGGETYKNSGNGVYTASKGHMILKAVKSASGESYADGEYDDTGGEDNPGDGNSVGSSNNWQLKYEDGRVLTYDGFGNLISRSDKHGNTYRYNYDSNYKLSSIVTPSGLNISISYNGNFLIDRITMPDGSTISYEYDSSKNLIKVTDQENRIIRYEYDSDHKMTAWYDADNIRQVLNTYDAKGRVVKQIDANGNESTITYEADRTIVTDSLGNEEVYTLDDKKRTTGIIYNSSVGASTASPMFGDNPAVVYEYQKSFNDNSKITEETDANGVVTTYTYDASGNIIEESRTDGTYTITKSYTYDSRNNKLSEADYNGNTTTYEYDTKNNLIKVTDAKGNSEEMTYDALSRLTSKKDKRGNITRYRYQGNSPEPSEIEDAKGNITGYTYDTLHRKISETDANSNTSTITYDRTGRKLKETDKRGNETNYTYSARGVVSKIKDREDNETTFTYDNVGNILTGTDSEGSTIRYEYDLKYNKVKEIDPLDKEKGFTYNDKGQVIEEIDALNHSKTYELDGIGNILKETDRNGNVVAYKYNNVLNRVIEKTDGNGKITGYNYDNNGNLLKEIKPDNSEITYEYDSLDQLTKVTNEIGTETIFTYDANGNITKKSIGAASTSVGASSASPFLGDATIDSRITEYTYDACNNLIEEKSPLGYISKIEYDSIGNISKLIDENNYTIEYTYDGNSNITKIKDAEGYEESYTYDKENHKKTYTDKNGNTTTFNYDRAGRVIEKISALNEKEELTYDSNDNIVKTTLYSTDGSIFSETERTYNALNKVVEEKDAENHTTTYTYDNNENVTSITNKNGDTRTFTYDASNNVIKSVDEMGLITEYEYDDNYNIIKISDNSNEPVGASDSVGASSASPVEIREYDRLGNLTKLTDAIGREETYEYNIFGEQVKKVDKDNAITRYDYDSNGNLSKVIRPDNQELIYTYDKHNKLIKTKLNDVIYEYTYDKNYNIIKEKNPLGNAKEYSYDNQGNVIEVKDEEGNITKNAYDSIGRVVKQTDGRNNAVNLKYDRNSNLTEVKTAENIINKYEYDKESRLIKEIDGENHFIEYEYDGLGNVLKKTTESNEVTTYTYDKHSMMTSMTDALGNIERYDINLSGQVIKKTKKDGTIYSYNYDKMKRLISTIDPMNYKINFTYSAGDDIIKTTDTLGREMNYEYDIMHNQTKKALGSLTGTGLYTEELWYYDYRGNVTRHIDKRENIEFFNYNLADNLIEHTDKNGNKTLYTYDKVGNIKEVKEPNGAKTLYDYDENYNRIKITNPRGKITSYAYDRDNRLISETDPNGNTKRYDYNNNNRLKEYTTALGNTQKYEYDSNNNLIKEIDPRNKEKSYAYDKLHRLTKTTSELNNTAIFTYDKVDNVIGIKDPKGMNTVFDYNSIGKVVQERSVDNTIRAYNYDRAGRLISKIDKDRTKIAYDYDENDNIIAKYYLDLYNREIDDKIIYSYNGENMRLGMRDKSGLTRTLYDDNGNMILSTSNNDKDLVRYEYDSNNRLIKMIYPGNIAVSYTYDENGNIKTVTDKDGLKTTYTYDDNDNEVIRTTGLIETNKRYDADNRLIRIKNEHRFTGELIDEYSYRYDSNNNIIEEIKREPYKKKINTLDIEPIEENDRTIRVTKQTFTYDAENKLTDARVERLGMKALTEPSVTTYHYEYDQNGNRTLVEIKDDGLTLESTVYEYDRLNKMIRSREVTRDGLYIYEYKYDDNGNLIQEDRHRQYEIEPVFYTNIRRYEYTKDNKLEAVYSGNTLLVAYTYDGDGTITSTLDRDLDLNQNLNINNREYVNRLTENQRQLINKINPSDTILYELTEYVLERNQEYSQVLMQRDGAGFLSTLYTYGNQRINSESINNLSGIYTYDGRGSVSAVIGGWGDFRATYWYDGLGNVKSQIHGYGAFGSGKRYFGYNAESYNPVTGNQNLRARQVNIRRQRFLTEDTYLGTQTDTLSINRYIYASDNPLRFKDPSGFMSSSGMSYASSSRSSNDCGGGNSDNSNYYIKYGFSSAESWEYWNNIATNAINAEIIKRGIIGKIANDQEAIIAGEILRDILSREQRFNSSIIGGLNPPTSNEILIAQAIHYTRNKYNNQLDLPKHVDFKPGTNEIIDSYFGNWYEEKRAIFHQHTVEGLSENIKYVDELGHREVIYNRTTGDLVIDARDIGTYNFSSPNDIINHYLLDVLTYYRWGNAPNDTTSGLGRLIGVVG